ncbi:MAG: hypothetical protein D6722_03160 [Bacteroidetes bacterium]|nr:MAG: hypothetical protein D6722_03160 [Bacteroidota bacterium]
MFRHLFSGLPWLLMLMACRPDGPALPAREAIFAYEGLEEAPLAPDSGFRFVDSLSGLQSTGWGVYEDIIYPGTQIRWELDHGLWPGREGPLLRCAITGGDAYNNVFFTHSLAMAPTAANWPYARADSLVYALDFYVQAEMDCGLPDLSEMEGIEFTLRHVRIPDSYGWALQWSKSGEWRYWDDEVDPKTGYPRAWQSFSPPLTTCLSDGGWHHLILSGVEYEGGVAYRFLELDGARYDLSGAICGPAQVPDGWTEDFLQVGMQINGNTATDPSHGEGVDPVTVWLDEVQLRGYGRE